MNSLSKYRATLETISRARSKDPKQQIANCLRKIESATSTHSAFEELKTTVRLHAKSSEKISSIVEAFIAHTEGMNRYKEALKFFNIMGEVLGANLIPVIPNILAHFKKRCEDSQYHVAISDSLGIMGYHLFKGIGNAKDKANQLLSIINQLLNFIKHSSKNVQIGISMCLNKLIKNSPAKTLITTLSSFVINLLKFIQSSTTKCTAQLFDVLITLLASVKQNFTPYIPKFLPVLIDSMKSQTMQVRKAAINAVYVLIHFLPLSTKPYASMITRSLHERRTDPAKDVRDAANEALDKAKAGWSERLKEGIGAEKAVKEVTAVKSEYFCMSDL
eukprot:TRINITY_DN8544_c0_g2_i13.p1 TRINITY_DN8544_c0_g2~~TRINITY_DN8544_c0_g2_i13.p1  ORF type:complete len:332 (+),score=34.23 TRINITY_DN8544_c0_g2_i13:82-1077(+)